ncbi:hypothetical protein MINS_29900 [Mycolicibacterium insubricum]|jgi:hypothetical protein|uniref:Uncharacterized protein n=1 Tax=Mycolicibacterium insubricum TaxID=444597 RepID=A0A1X0DHX3_9MYCO|nr:DUF4139 domain-containing protein [Mycolicibacterium insubricum]MCB9441457.1 DUF4139 domain-containing protein [Mycolicibacterium sp.]MCV7080071.1 DUF4139 domain-containing protein [Mycolicibacterium insubricum]ORA71984.1 hypothetical protein BST26_06460 [Mycolicibacterium insubricum]BBZ67561.1 hypothetical protein MINS_29900 [Mycolicibacterium insubricum]
MNTPPVDRLVLYKHGIALVGRSGPVDGDFELTLRREDMPDVLKSLSVEVADGAASVGAISFDSPSEPARELAERNLLLGSGAALVGLLDAVRGRMVEVDLGEGVRRRGEVVGVDDSGPDRRVLLLRTESGTVSLVDLAGAHGVQLAEEPSRQDLDYLVDRSRAASAGPTCTVGVVVRGRAERVALSYIVPSPMWRVSYRLVRTGERLALTALGLVHNPLDEDLRDVALTLTTGQPVSFDIDLYHPRTVHRAVIEERERGADLMVAGGIAPSPPSGAGPVSRSMAAPANAYAVDRVETGDRGEYFEYRIPATMSIKRGGAAMVPLAVSEADDVRRELVWADGEDRAPDITLTFTNSTGIVLEEGPAVIYEDGGYAGEAMVDFTARGATVRLAFAKDLAVRCSRDADVITVAVRVQLAQEAAVEERRRQKQHTLTVENDHDEPVTVVFELSAHPDHLLSPAQNATALPPPGRHTRRFQVTAPAHATATASVLETWSDYTQIDYQQLAPGRLDDWLAGRSLDTETIGALSGVLGNWEQAKRLDARCEQLTVERDDVFAAQSRIAEQLAVLGTDGPEGELRARQVGELQRRIAQVTAIEAGIAEVRADAAAARQAATNALGALIGS